MPTDTETALPTTTIKQLHDGLAAIGFKVVGEEAGPNPRFGTATIAQLKTFQQRYKLPVTGELDPTSGGVLSLAALVATESDRAAVQAKLKQAMNNVPNSQLYSYWLARYAIMAGDYATAQTAIKPFLGQVLPLPELGSIIDPISQPSGPDVPHPENFYNYREGLIDQQTLDRLRSDMETLASSPQDYQQYLSQSHGIAVLDSTRFTAAIALARAALAALSAWQKGNRLAVNREFSLAMQSYNECQFQVQTYCDGGVVVTGTTISRIQNFLKQRQQDDRYSAFWGALRWRRTLLALWELAQNDREKPVGNDGSFSSAAAFLTSFTYIPDDPNWPLPTANNQMTRLDPLLIVMGSLWVPMAIGELNCQLRQFETALYGHFEQRGEGLPQKDLYGLLDLLDSQTNVDVQFRYWCEFIEIPFIRLLSLEALLDKADAEYKTGAKHHQSHLPLAQISYEQVGTIIAEDGQYEANIAQGRDNLVTSIQQRLHDNDTTSLAFRSLGKAITVPTITAVTSALPGLDRALGPHQSIATINGPGSTNPRVYAIGLFASAKLEQIKAGFNYLGYPADYVPPWRFSFLLDRARFFAEHAKNAQRDYLNFLSNAENEEFQEQSAAQNVEMEKSNIRIETARVDQALAEVSVSQAGVDSATQVAQDAKFRFENYVTFEETMSELDAESSILGGLASIAKAGTNVGELVASGFDIAGSFVKDQGRQAERDLERENLSMAITEADLAANIANKKLQEAQAGLVVAGLQRQAAILRHEFAVENLNYLRGKTLNADQWYRLANAIRRVSDTYLHYAIEVAFLAQQAYEFESDRLIEVIRFDYDLSDVGKMLAADFLLRDLDTLEQDLIVSEQTRQEQVRYVLSMSREYPETLRTLSETGEVTFSMRLEQLERHFPGLFMLRISSVDVQPVALMDPSRVTMELTHLGPGMIRLKAQPGTSPLNSRDVPASSDWLGTAGAEWPVKIQVSGPETAVFSGLSRQEAAGLSTTTASERGAFERLPGASSWRIDMSMKENKVVPGTLADVLITFVMSGYYDAKLNDAVTAAALSARPLATTSFISARSLLPDAYYSLVHYGRLDWDVSEGMLSLAGSPNELRNVAVALPLVQNGPELGRCYCRYPISIHVAPGTVNVLTALPQLTMTPNGLTLNCAFTGPASTQASWDFGDGTPLAQGATAAHTYARPGRFEIVTRLVQKNELIEYRSAVVVSATHPANAPLTVTPVFSASAVATDGTVTLTISTPGVTDVSLDCSAGIARGRADSGPLTLKLKPGTYLLDFLATRKLSARFYSKQRYLPAAPIVLNRDRIATNRTFDVTTGAETTASLNAFGALIFKNGNATVALSPVDRWTLELPLADNPWFVTVSPSDIAEFDGGELADAILGLEFMSTQ
jgi:peptidoglycan hydrolase-like protein with peptidoglycan-binding domain